MEKAKQKTKKLRGAARTHTVGFLEFIRGYGVVGLAIGIVIGTAVTKLVTTMVSSLINPFVGLFIPAKNLSEASFTINGSVFVWGAFASALIDFFIIAAVVYFGIKGLGLDKLDKKKESSE